MARKVYIGVENFTKRDLPSGYTQVEYIESTGTQYIDTGFTPNQDTRVVMDCDLAGTVDGYAGLFASRQTGGAKQAFAFYHSDDTGKPYDQYNAITIQTGDSNLLGRHTIDKNKNETYVDGTLVNTFTYASFTGSCDLRLFADKQPNTDVKHFAVGKIYSCKIWNNNSLIRNYIPCINASGNVGLYDLVGAKFYGNNGTGTFTAGSSEPKGVARKVKQMYVGVSDKARRVKKAYIGIGGVARPFWGSGELAYYGTITPLCDARSDTSTASNGNYALFAGGQKRSSSYYPVNTVDAYNSKLVHTIPTKLSIARNSHSSATVGDYALFAGGNAGGTAHTHTNVVNAYDTSLTMSTPTVLSQSRYALGGTFVRDYALFAGGTASKSMCDTVDAYNKSLVRSTPTALRSGRWGLAGASVGDYAIFSGGGTDSSRVSSISNTVDAYNASLTRTSVASFTSMDYYLVTGTTAKNHALFVVNAMTNSTIYAYDKSLTMTAPANLTNISYYFATTALGDYVIYAGGTDEIAMSSLDAVEVFDKSFTKITTFKLSEIKHGLSGISIGDYALFGGGYEYTNYKYLNTVEAFTI